MIVPTRDQFRLIRTCVESLRQTDYPNFEIIVVDNGTTCPKAAAYLDDVAARPGCRVIADDRPFNFSALNNLAVAEAAGEYVAFINNDVEATDPAWLSEMMSHAVLPDVGAVGCKLLYGDGRIQHAGVILGIGHLGIADHSHKYFDPSSSGHFHRPHLQQYASAVTGACMVVSKRKFLEAGGFDAEHLAVAFNDVDLCLRLAECGYRNYYTPYAVLFHHESMTRGRDPARREGKALCPRSGLHEKALARTTGARSLLQSQPVRTRHQFRSEAEVIMPSVEEQRRPNAGKRCCVMMFSQKPLP